MKKLFGKFVALVSLLAFMFGAIGSSTAEADSNSKSQTDKVIFFAADGMRQDLVKTYADQRLMPNMRELLKHGVQAGDNGLLTQAPTNTGAGWYSLSTGAWAGVHGSTNNTFAINGAPFANRTSAFDATILQAESLAQAAERGGRKVAQIEWAGGRNGAISGPTVDFRSFLSGRGVATNYISPTDDANFTASFGFAVRSPGWVCGAGPLPGRGSSGRCRLDECPSIIQPGQRDAPAGTRFRHRQVRLECLYL